ncbi:unnamed protein product, partial [Nesidiocoris tenuis]
SSTMNCFKCQLNLLSEDALPCSSCKRSLHFGCAGQSESNFRKMSKAVRSSWRCVDCRGATRDGSPSGPKDPTSQNDAFLQSIFLKMNEQIAQTIRQELHPFKEEITQKLTAMQTSIDSCSDQYMSLSGELASLREELLSLKSDNLQARVKTLEDKFSAAPPPSGVDEEALFSEIEDRRRRSQNVLFFNVPESSSPNPSIAASEDLSQVNNYMASVFPVDPVLAQRGLRLGKRSEAHIRPLKIVFPNSSAATRVLSTLRSNKSAVFPVSDDKTLRQRDFLNRLRTELTQRKENGEPHLTIRYVSGVPRIVPATHQKKRGPLEPSSGTLTAPADAHHTLSIYYQNVRGLNTKLTVLHHEAPHLTFDVIIFTETWLSNQVATGELRLSNYSVFRTDRSPKNNMHKSGPGGGVLVGVLNKYLSYQWSPIEDTVEHAAVLVPQFRLIVSAIYLPSYQPADVLESYLSQLESISLQYPTFAITIVGDFNLPGVCSETWNGDVCPSSSSAKTRLLFTSVKQFDLKQYNSLPNPSGNVLDLCFSNLDLQLNVADPLLRLDLAHPPFVCTINVPEFRPYHVTQQFEFNFARGDYASMESYLSTVDWSGCTTLPLNLAVDYFYEVIRSAISLFVPRIRPVNHSYPKWFTAELIQMVQQKRRAHSRYKATGNDGDYKLFSDLRKSCGALSRSLYNAYLNDVQSSLLTNVKAFWNYVNYKDGVSSPPPTTMTYMGRQSDSLLETANLFAQYFSSVYEQPVLCEPSYPVVDVVSIGLVSVSLGRVQQALASLDPTKGMGPDGVPPILLRNCPSLAIPLHALFNKSLVSGTFPQVWKASFLTPIHKQGSRSAVDHYRPISTLSTIPKTFEKLVLQDTAPLLYPVIAPQQHGFVPGRSTLSNLVAFQEYVLGAFEGGVPAGRLHFHGLLKGVR